ncbi:MAG: hypothetical protein EA425_18495 [Puniceicoccaceae bacterium]|nr:MAG: hypothetical protein EA425_18495 [Puniceicoccaceae bacterium]
MKTTVPATDLARFVNEAPLADTHEHLLREQEYLRAAPDVLTVLFANYQAHDLITAGADPKAVKRAGDSSDPDLKARFAGIESAWRHCRFTGYGEATRLMARTLYDLEEITADSLEKANQRNRDYLQPGSRLRLLREVAGLDHVQTDRFETNCLPDAEAPDFFHYDLSMAAFASGNFDVGAIADQTGIAIASIDQLEEALAKLFDRFGPNAIAVKSQHAYQRSLRWMERTRDEAAAALRRKLDDRDYTEEARLCLGDWCLDRVCDLARRHHLPLKIHTGYLAGNWSPHLPRTAAGQLGPLLHKHPGTRFVLMHLAYGQHTEISAIAKQFPNVFLDLCWAWSLDPHATTGILRGLLHSVPFNKLLVFGGDTGYPQCAVGYALQARRGLAQALDAEVSEGLVSEAEALEIAAALMHGNAAACFDRAT